MSRVLSVILIGVVMLLVAGRAIGSQPVTTVHDILADLTASVVYPHAQVQATAIEDPKAPTSFSSCCVDHGGFQRLVMAPASAAQVQAWYRKWLLANGWSDAHGAWAGGYCRGNDSFVVDTGPAQQTYDRTFTPSDPRRFLLPRGWTRVLTIFEIYGHSTCG